MDSKLLAALVLTVQLVACRSTTPMVGVQQSQNTNSKVATGMSVTMSEPSTEKMALDSVQQNNLECIFGRNIGDISNSVEFELEKRGTVERMAPTKNLQGKNLLFAYSEYVHKATNIRYAVFNTFLKSVDGGVTRGWIQTSLGQEVVAEVDDGDIVNCRVISQNTMKSNYVFQDSCLFGFELNELMESSQFKISFEREIFRVGRIPHETKRRPKYRMFKLSEAKNAKSQFVMYLRSSDHQGSKNFNGWIETLEKSELVALIGESEIYECVVDTSGAITGKISEGSEDCIFGKDFHDMEISPNFILSSLESEITMASRVKKSQKQKAFKRRALLHQKTGKSYIVFHTFRDEDDEGRTQGWIEAIDGKLVAEISENAIRNCNP